MRRSCSVRLVPALLLGVASLLASPACATDVSGDVSGVWDLTGSPYVVVGHVNVPAGALLDIREGVEVRFDGPYRLTIPGEMKAIGTPEAPILFTRNRPTDDSRWRGIRLTAGGGRLTMRHCIVEWADTRSEGVSLNYGALYIKGDVWADVRRCTFRYNEAVRGAGLSLFSAPVAVLEGLLIHDNHATSKGGGIYAISSNAVALTNCTIVSNRADVADGEGLHIASSTAFWILNCIFWDNGSVPIWDYVEPDHDIKPHLDYSCVEGGPPYPGEGNISANPSFVNFAGKDFRLAAGSPCIDAGHPSRLYRDLDATRCDMGHTGGRWPGATSPAAHLNFANQSGIHQLANGGAQSWGDYDNDGREDLLTGGKLYRNLGGTFQDVTTALFPGGSVGQGCWGDYDNDGWLDIMVPGSPTQYLYRNLGGAAFEERAAAAGVVINDPTFRSDTATWFDYDQDSYLDLYICGSGDFDVTTWPDYLFHNNGDGTFTDVSGPSGIREFWPWDAHGRALGACDYDDDGDPDLYVGNYWLYPNFHLNNDGDGTFTDVGEALGTCGTGVDAGEGRLYYGHTIGLTWTDLDLDGKFDLVVSNLAHPAWLWFSDPVMIYLNEGGPTLSYTEARAYCNIRYEETHSAVVAADWDNDADQDLFFTSVYDGRRSFLYEQTEPLWFTECTVAGNVYFDNGWGATANDFDGDGKLDLIAFPGGDPYLGVFRNTTHDTGHYARFRLQGTVSNRAAIGARLYAETGTHTYIREIQSTMGTNTTGHGFVAHFGLGTATVVNRLLVHWPNGLEEQFGPFAADATYTLVEGTGSPPASVADVAPAGLRLQCGPNPWQTSTEIRFTLNAPSAVRLEFFDPSGRRVAVLADRTFPAGSHRIPFAPGTEISPGVYLYRIRADRLSRTGRCVRLD